MASGKVAPSRKTGSRTRPFPKGRQVSAQSLDDVRETIGPGPYRRDLLIEYLHGIQDRYGHLSAAHLAALADVMHLAQTEVFEVATFYAHFDVVPEGGAVPPPRTVRVCDSLTCSLFGAESLLADLGAIGLKDVRVVRAPCMGRCHEAPVATVGHNAIARANPATVRDALSAGHVEPDIPSFPGLDEYRAGGGYALLAAARRGERTREQLIEGLETSGLRGLGGAGFPTGRKWRIVSGYPGPRLMAVNADEGEPGTFKDGYYLSRDPHRFLEGMLIAAHVVEAQAIYIYLRDEYPDVHAILDSAIATLAAAGLLAGIDVQLRRGAGAYICGEESAMLESIEGKRGLPRHRPPYVAENGLFGRPTLVQNAETLYWIRDLLERGPDWFTSEGRRGRKGLRSFSVSGRVREPGVKLAPAGISVRELIDEYCGGMADGYEFSAYLPGGASGGILPASMGDLPLDFGTLEEHGCFIGSAAIVVLGHRDSVREATVNLMRFFADESCGQCTPCRRGTEKAVQLLQQDTVHRATLEDLCQVMADASICGLGQAAPNPVRCLLRYFPEELA